MRCSIICATCFQFLLLAAHSYLVFLIAESLQEYFQAFGEVGDCIVMRDVATKRSRYLLLRNLSDD